MRQNRQCGTRHIQCAERNAVQRLAGRRDADAVMVTWHIFHHLLGRFSSWIGKCGVCGLLYIDLPIVTWRGNGIVQRYISCAAEKIKWPAYRQGDCSVPVGLPIFGVSCCRSTSHQRNKVGESPELASGSQGTAFKVTSLEIG